MARNLASDGNAASCVEVTAEARRGQAACYASARGVNARICRMWWVPVPACAPAAAQLVL